MKKEKLEKLLVSEGYKPEEIPVEIERRKNLELSYRKLDRFRQKYGGKGIHDFIIDFEKRITTLEHKI